MLAVVSMAKTTSMRGRSAGSTWPGSVVSIPGSATATVVSSEEGAQGCAIARARAERPKARAA